MTNQFIKMFLATLSSDAMKEVAVTVMYELSKLTDNKVDDELVKAVAKALDVALKD